MSQLIRDLLEFSKLGKAEMTKKETSMTDIVKAVIDEVKFTSQARGYEIIRKDVADVCCEARLVKQVWLNLIGNAVKYSGKKEFAVVEIGSNMLNGEVVYYVKDNGAGFDMKHTDKLFGVFKRLHSTSEFEGTGVGLATVQRIVNRHGGRIWAEAKIDEGATFYFTLTASAGLNNI